MTTLAPKLPYNHQFAGGYPRVAGQPTPTDPDCLDYLARLSAADGGAGVEVGVAMAIQSFIQGCKADSAGYAGDPTRSNWDAIQACCIMAGARTIAGATVPLKRPYGTELVDIDNLPTPSVYNDGYSGGVWTAGSRTASNTSVGTGNYPRFNFNFGATTGKAYYVTGRLSGSLNAVYGFRAEDTQNYTAYNATTGEFSGRIVAGAPATFQLLLNSSLGASSVTIESLSIREDSFTPTPYNFASGDYSRAGATPGIKGDGSTKYINTNRPDSADGQDDHHIAVYSTAGDANNSKYAIGVLNGGSPASYTILGRDYWSHSATYAGAAATVDTGTYALSRGSGSTFDWMRGSVLQTPAAKSSTSSTSGNSHFVFGYNSGGSLGTPISARLAFYSIGSACDLSAMDARVTALVRGIQFAQYTGLSPADFDDATVAYIVAAYIAGGTL